MDSTPLLVADTGMPSRVRYIEEAKRSYRDRWDVVSALYRLGAHFVLCRDDKKPVRGWRDPASLEEIKDHDGLLGIIPASVGATVLDVDEGSPAPLREEYPPAAEWPTPRGTHLLYFEDAKRGNEKLDLCGAQGDVRSAKGYVILWPGALSGITRAGIYGQSGEPPPAASPTVPELTAEEGGFRGRSLAHVSPGERNNRLFDAVRYWRYRHRGADCWPEAKRLNDTFPVPLKEKEVRQVAASVQRFCDEQEAESGFRQRLEEMPDEVFALLQAARGRRSGVARRRKQRRRDDTIRHLARTGLPATVIAARVGVSAKTVRRIVEREMPRFEWRRGRPKKMCPRTLSVGGLGKVRKGVETELREGGEPRFREGQPVVLPKPAGLPENRWTELRMAGGRRYPGKYTTARKRWKCFACGGMIVVGQIYIAVRHYAAGRRYPETRRVCGRCG